MELILCRPDGMARVVELPRKHDYKDLKKLLGIDSPLTCISRKVGKAYYDFWCDDEGLLKDGKMICGVCTVSGAMEVICGNILISRHGKGGEIAGLTKKDIWDILDRDNFIRNVDFLHVSERVRTYPRDASGTPMVIRDYHGFGSIGLSPDGYMLRYSI